MRIGPFRVQDALAAGLSVGQLRSKRWRSPWRGVRVDCAAPSGLVADCHALATVLPPEATFSGITAARLRGWWLPQGA